jgi:hypothetical protein
MKNNKMKQCKQCSIEFEPKNFRGTEQNYCSKECRTKAGNERYKLKLMTNGNSRTNLEGSTRITGTERNENARTKEFFGNDNYRRETDISIEKQSVNNPDILRYLEQSFEARTDAFKFELKYENALKEIEKLKQEIVELELELQDEPEPKQGIAGMLENIPEWLTPAIGKLLQSEKVQKFVISNIPEPEPQN